VGFARCFWRACQAIGDAPFHVRHSVATILYMREQLDEAKSLDLRRHERYLAYAPWRSPEAAAAFRASLEADPVPRIDWKDLVERAAMRQLGVSIGQEEEP
jgi:hypothetical protein